MYVVLMCAEFVDNIKIVLISKVKVFFSWADGNEALRDALDMEKRVSLAIKGLITMCEGVEDYYSADYLTGTWLEEQLHGQRELAGMINTLSNFRKDHEDLADWMFSNTLL